MTAALQTALPLNLIVAAEQAGIFGSFLAAIEKAGLTEQLLDAGPITIFAPTDSAFAQFPTRTWESFEKNQASLLRNMLTCHIAAGLITSDKFAAAPISVKTNQGARFPVDGANGQNRIGSAVITHPDIVAVNGVLHGIDGLLWFAANPPQERRGPRRDAR
jgi:uncharacterized surface protein with fasciclin (FAS1) repeats